MTTLGSPSPPLSPSRTMRRRGCARRVERYCCVAVTYFPLLFVYGLTSWAVWVEAGIGFMPARNRWTGKFTSSLGIFLYLMLNWSYTTAVFTDPGSPLNLNNGYTHLPMQEEGGPQYTSFTVKTSTGDLRYCKKCQTKKPDRSHHCSTCKRCVLKMDHHCPWLATCVGLYNYKAFLLFLIYTTFFCWVCFATSALWVWTEIINDPQITDSFVPVNCVLLAVLAGIIGLVLAGFTAWHIWLTIKGQTTIESLEKTRYLSPIRNSMRDQLSNRNYIEAQANGRASISDQLREIHANALPGVTRPEEGESTPKSRSPAPTSAHMSNGYSNRNYNSYEQRERQHEEDRYASYLEELDNERLPNAFDLGWKRNLGHIFGPSPHLWPLPIKTTTGDGWSWEASPQWVEACDRIKQARETEDRIQKQRERAAGWGVDSPTEAEFRRNGHPPPPEGWQVNRFSPPRSRAPRRPEWQASRPPSDNSRYLTTSNGIVSTPQFGRRSTSKADQILGRENGMYADGDVQLQNLDRRKFDQYNYISDDDDEEERDAHETRDLSPNKVATSKKTTPPPPKVLPLARVTKDWNDIPDDFLTVQGTPKDKPRKRSKSPELTITPGTSTKTTANGEWDDWGKDA
ncbi:palmitoyltransferas-like protein PFA3 [Periconia macrospinosa]|uniref:Palmitoyltransferase n=1 Tax=Periconia macrospinosa TaxID=97972 RepID=A0A2V1E581_9PLEO|nr:palmitoyltransferas-like protein PFA3 [Periconia macrospinosa]